MTNKHIIMVLFAILLIGMVNPVCLDGQSLRHNQVIKNKSKSKSTQESRTGTKIAKNNDKATNADSLAKLTTDTLEKRDRITEVSAVGDAHIVKIELRDYNSEIAIAVYNLIGKKVLDVYKGQPKNSPDYPYEIQSWRLPSGVYICSLITKESRKTVKFVISK